MYKAHMHFYTDTPALRLTLLFLVHKNNLIRKRRQCHQAIKIKCNNFTQEPQSQLSTVSLQLSPQTTTFSSR